MNFDHSHYVPCLRWKQGEYQAVLRLHEKAKKKFTPLIQVPEFGYDFEKGKEPKVIDKHIEPFAKRVHDKWGKLPCFVDLKLINPSVRLENKTHPVKYVFDDLRRRGCYSIPVTGLGRDKAYQQAIKSILIKDKSGVCLRVSIEEAAKGSFATDINSLLSTLNVQVDNCDLIMDLVTPNFEPLDGFSKVIQNIVKKIPYLAKWRTFSLIGTSFPKSMGGIKTGVTNIPRHEWQIYKIIIHSFKKAGLRLPTFGDYAISHPDIPDLDWRVVKPKVKIRYTVDDKWYLVKGKNYRDYGYGQYHELSKQILNSGYYYGPTFSWGDKYIQQCANGGSTGHLTMWVGVDTNHHIEKVIQDIASFYDS
ncbi:MAG: hypothetical protein FVQ80_11655 [Planctomycetes bacterium]|nr:hypothetical protein [Planctomycetota bacterium]